MDDGPPEGGGGNTDAVFNDAPRDDVEYLDMDAVYNNLHQQQSDPEQPDPTAKSPDHILRTKPA